MKCRFIIAFFTFFISTILFPLSYYTIPAERLYNKAKYGATAGVALAGGIIAGTFQIVAPWAYVEYFIVCVR